MYFLQIPNFEVRLASIPPMTDLMRPPRPFRLLPGTRVGAHEAEIGPVGSIATSLSESAVRAVLESNECTYRLTGKLETCKGVRAGRLERYGWAFLVLLKFD